MKQLLLSLSLLAIFAVGCNETTTPTAKKTDGETASQAANADSDHSDLLEEVNKASFESVINDNSLTLVEFTAVW